MLCYKLRRDEFNQEDTGRYVGFGIDVFDRGKLLRSIKDISRDKNELLKLILLCNELCLELIHLDDVIEDFLA